MPESLKSFLTSGRDLLSEQTGKPQERVVVIGNESADLDSCVSSILYSYLASAEDSHQRFIPVFNMAREDIKLRKELIILLEKAGLSEDDISCREDITGREPTC